MQNYFLTVRKNGHSDFRDRGSKFFGKCFRVDSKAEIDRHLEELKKEYYDARHHCYAYCLGEKSETQFASDDGEPAHSAGDPILGQIRKKSLTNTLVVVIRYFGGTKLGVPGLINAYKTAAEESLEDGGVKKVELVFKVKIVYPYESTSAVEQFMHQNQLKHLDQEFTDKCELLISGPVDRRENILNQLNTLLQRSQIINFTEIED